MILKSVTAHLGCAGYTLKIDQLVNGMTSFEEEDWDPFALMVTDCGGKTRPSHHPHGDEFMDVLLRRRGHTELQNK